MFLHRGFSSEIVLLIHNLDGTIFGFDGISAEYLKVRLASTGDFLVEYNNESFLSVHQVLKNF